MRVDRCGVPHCRGIPGMTFLGLPVCDYCWERYCADPPKLDLKGIATIKVRADEIKDKKIEAEEEARLFREHEAEEDKKAERLVKRRRK